MTRWLENYLENGNQRPDKTDRTLISRSSLAVSSVLSVPGSPISKVFPATANLADWLNEIGRIQTAPELMALLSAFRARPWTDEECAQVSRAYMRRLNRL